MLVTFSLQWRIKEQSFRRFMTCKNPHQQRTWEWRTYTSVWGIKRGSCGVIGYRSRTRTPGDSISPKVNGRAARASKAVWGWCVVPTFLGKFNYCIFGASIVNITFLFAARALSHSWSVQRQWQPSFVSSSLWMSWSAWGARGPPIGSEVIRHAQSFNCWGVSKSQSLVKLCVNYISNLHYIPPPPEKK